MFDLEKLMQQGGSIEMNPISGNEREAIAEKMVHISELKAGDKVQWKKSMRDAKYPQYDQVVEVFRILPEVIKGEHGNNHAADECDFSAIFKKEDGEIVEFIYDSRRFERVEVTAK